MVVWWFFLIGFGGWRGGGVVVAIVVVVAGVGSWWPVGLLECEWQWLLGWEFGCRWWLLVGGRERE